MKTKNKLAPCPFCGGKASFFATPKYESGPNFLGRTLLYCVKCLRCGAQIQDIKEDDDKTALEIAAEKWNQREKNHLDADARHAFIDVTVDGRTFMLYKVKTKTFYVSDSRMNIRTGDTLIIRMSGTDEKICLRVLCTFEGEQGVEDDRVICSVKPEEEGV